MPTSPMSRAARRVGLAGKLLLALASMVGTALALEGGARWLNLDTGFFLVPGGANCLQRSRTLSVEFRPHCIGELKDTHFGTNALGYRGTELRDDGSVRILAVGDSCTWGWRVGEDETYPAVLQQRLDQRYGVGRFQVLNAGVPGYTSYQVLNALREKGLPLRPAIVLIAAGFNDLFRTGDVEQQIASERRLFPLLRVDDVLLDNSRFYRWARWRMGGSGQAVGAVRVTPAGYARNVRDAVDAARSHGAHAMLVSFWFPLTADQDYRLALIDAAQTVQAPLVTYDGPLIDLVHPTPEGYRLLVDDLVTALQTEGWLS